MKKTDIRNLYLQNKRKKIISIIGNHASIYFIIVTISICLLLIGSLFPQILIDKNIRESIPVFESEGSYPHIGDKQESSKLDNFTDSLILMESATMQMKELQTIFSNPMYFKSNPATEFSDFIERREAESPTGYYVRYWMGFRTPVRLCLVFMNYSQIRSLLAWIILGLLITVSFYIARYTDIRTGILFAVSIIFIKPQVLCNSLQFSCCFIIAMLAMLFIPYVIQKEKETIFFFALGMVTMYFDFYTSPLVVLGYPLIFWILLKTYEKPQIRASLFLMIEWMIGYGMMWLTKLLCATIFTEVNGFVNGLSSFAMRTGIIKRADLMDYYGVNKAFHALKKVILPDFNTTLLVCVILIGIFVTLVIGLVRNRKRQKLCTRYITLFFPIVVMIVWYMVAAQPTTIHAYFQYRNIAMAIWGGQYVFQPGHLSNKK